MPACPVCATENPDVARFCLSCGAALTAEPAREERKVVTVLFADLVGFTSRAEQLDPEDVRAVLAPYWDRLRTELEQRGGTVEKFIGDAVMALFGAPVAHEDDPLRAVGAALAIRDWAREEADVQVRIAVNTGEALVLLGARPAEGEGMAAGDVVNTTARLQAAAPVNGILVGETTYRATRDVVEYRECEPVQAKGKAEPVPVWEAVQVRSRLGMDVERATLPLVGRVRELGVILDAFDRARADREPQLVTLVGVPGIGKSRLVGEFFARLEQQPDLVWWRQGRALPYGEGVSLWALAEMVKAQAGIEENESVETAREKLAGSVARVVAADERAWVLEHLLPLVGGEHRGAGGDSMPAWRAYFEGLAEQRPLVLVFEDMHWADEGLLDFIDHLVDWATGVPLLVIATARPELLDRRPSWGGGKLNVSTIALTPLSDEDSAQIIHTVLERSALPAETQRALVERAGGNPLYAEQFARLFLERGSVDDLPLPENVQGLIAARIDGLPPDEKQLLHEAAVYGKVFWGGALGADVENALHALERKGMLRRERRSAVAGETQYAFRHVLVRDVAYGQIPRSARGAKHERAAGWIEALGRAEDHAELVAHHLGIALELGADVVERARLAHRRAGERAWALGAFPVAARYFAVALDLWPVDDPERPLVVAEHARAVYRATGSTAQLGEALDALERAGRREEAAQVAIQAASAAWYESSYAADDYLARAEQLLEGIEDGPARASLLAERGRIAFFRGEYESAERDLAGGLELATRFELDELRAGLLTTTGVVRMTDGELDEARRLFQDAVALAPPASQPALRALSNIGVLEVAAGDYHAWREAHAAALEVATRAGDVPHLRWLESASIIEAFDFGRWDEAVKRGRSHLDKGDDAWILVLLSQINAARGAVDAARTLRDRLVVLLEEGDYPQIAIPARVVSAWTSFVIGDDARARELIESARPLVATARHRAPGVSAAAVTAVLRTGPTDEWAAFHARNADTTRVVAARLMMTGRHADAADVWARVSPFDEAVARLWSGEQLAAEGRDAEAEVQLERGLAFFRAVGATRIVERAQSLLIPAAAAE